jgi:NAD-dependent deacetylase
MSDKPHNAIQRAANMIRNTRSLFVLTGAGISAESGIPTFRGKDGLWKNYSAMDLATPEAFGHDPELVWEWYHWRQDIIRNAQPNTGHQALVVIERHTESFMLLTQNVDNLHQRAGSVNVVELHGNIFRTRCTACGTSRMYGVETSASTEKTPQCTCGGLLRPDVVWFGESIPQDAWRSALNFLSSADTALICGTSGVVWPAAALPEYAKHYHLNTIEINLEHTPISSVVDLSIPGRTGEILPEIAGAL